MRKEWHRNDIFSDDPVRLIKGRFREKRRFITHSRAIQVYVPSTLNSGKRGHLPHSVASSLSGFFPIPSIPFFPPPHILSSFLRTNSGRSPRYDPGIGINEATIIKKRNFILSLCVCHSTKFYYARREVARERPQKSGYFFREPCSRSVLEFIATWTCFFRGGMYFYLWQIRPAWNLRHAPFTAIWKLTQKITHELRIRRIILKSWKLKSNNFPRKEKHKRIIVSFWSLSLEFSPSIIFYSLNNHLSKPNSSHFRSIERSYFEYRENFLPAPLI